MTRFRDRALRDGLYTRLFLADFSVSLYREDTDGNANEKERARSEIVPLTSANTCCIFGEPTVTVIETVRYEGY